MKMKRYICNNEDGTATIIEAMTAFSICIVLLALFFISANSFYNVYDRPDVDLQAKSIDICETLINLPGLGVAYNLNWEADPVNVLVFGLGASPLVEYGTFHQDEQGKITNICRYVPSQNNLTGITRSCFLAETKILMADGSSRNIEEIMVGDIVKSFNMKTGKMVNRMVINVFHHTPDEMTEYYLVINNILKITPNHMLYINEKWTISDSIKVGDMVNNLCVYSVEKVFEQVPTFDLEVEKDHNYCVQFYDTSIIVHNENIPDIDWQPWLPASKAVYPKNDSIEPYGGSYYINYTALDDGGNHLYMIKGETNNPYPILDSQKISILSEGKLSYEVAKSALGLGTIENVLYNFQITIRNETSTVITYGYEPEGVTVSTTRNILIYYPPVVNTGNPTDVQPPYYEDGQITVSAFLGGSVAN